VSDAGRHLDRHISISKNGRYVLTPTVPDGARFPSGNFWKFARTPVRGRYPVVALRGHSGIGWHWDTMFYRIRGGRLQTVGRAPADNSNGPVNWRGRDDLWLFDDHDRYLARDDERFRPNLLLYRIDSRSGRMRLLRRWPSPRGSVVRDTVRLNRW
jgi:hypothetical protein